MDTKPKRLVGRPFQKGQSGNPKGRPKRQESVTEILHELSLLKDVNLPSGEKITRRRALAEQLWTQAIRNGDISAIKFIIERLEGKTPSIIQGPMDEEGRPTEVTIRVIQKRSIDEWQHAYIPQMLSGNPSPDKLKPYPVQPSNSFSEEQRAAEKQTS